jgi:hypothetical protein
MPPVFESNEIDGSIKKDRDPRGLNQRWPASAVTMVTQAVEIVKDVTPCERC